MTSILGLLKLCGIFLYIGLFAIGGGLVAATFIQQILVEKLGLLTLEKFYSMLAISESTPGPIGINLATYVGTELYGPIGGILVTVSEVLPAMVIIMLISKFFSDFQKKPLVQSAFSAIRPATGGIVLVAMVNVIFLSVLNVSLFKESGNFLSLFRLKELIFYTLSCILLFAFKKLHPVFIVLAGAVFGILFF